MSSNEQELRRAYRDAALEWENSSDAALWENTIADGIERGSWPQSTQTLEDLKPMTQIQTPTLRDRAQTFGLSLEEFDLVVDKMEREPNALEHSMLP